MPGKELVTEACVRAMAPGSELLLGPGRIATPAALDAAFERGIRVRREGEAAAAGGSSRSACGCDQTCLWSRLKASEGTYIVTVRDGRATVLRVDGKSVTPFGEE